MFLDMLAVAIVSVVAYPLQMLIGVFSRSAKDRFCLKFVSTVMKTLLFMTGTKVVYKGLEHLPAKDETVVYIGNHRGNFDCVATYAVVPGLTGFVAKKEMKSWPLFGWWMSTVYCLFLDRDDKRQGIKTILSGIKYVEKGISMVIYPEGTRSRHEGILGEFHAGSFKLATKPGVKIIPVAANNSGAIWDDHMPWFKSTTMCLEFCEPIETAGLDKEEQDALPGRVHDILQEAVIRNGIEIGSLPEGFKLEQE